MGNATEATRRPHVGTDDSLTFSSDGICTDEAELPLVQPSSSQRRRS